MIRSLYTLAASLSGFFLSPICVTCGKKIDDSAKYICRTCRDSLLKSGLKKIVQPDKVGAAVFYYLYSYEACDGIDLGCALRTLKYYGHWKIAHELAALIYAAGMRKGVFQKIDFITSIPLHPAKLRERGFNQSQLIASRLAVLTGLPYVNLLRRKRNTAQQAELSAPARELNVKDAFALLKPVNLSDKRIILLDDQITTGETLDNAGKILIAADAAAVLGLSLTH